MGVAPVCRVRPSPAQEECHATDPDSTATDRDGAYDPATDTWTPKAPMPAYDTIEMGGFSVVAVAGMLYALGGSEALGYVKAYQP
ncbi:MAG TPA: hypothetical protein VGQ48_10545 [Gemmatimonadales bacterium]|jgi:hypothetical protein|nr:hypothetical protein [Gemmatimonadales bacterium]